MNETIHRACIRDIKGPGSHHLADANHVLRVLGDELVVENVCGIRKVEEAHDGLHKLTDGGIGEP